MGRVMEIGEERTSQNGYVYVKCQNGKWRLKHHIVAEARLGRGLYSHERVKFGPAGKTDFSDENVIVESKGSGSVRKRLAVVEDRIRELNAERDLLLEQLASPTNNSHKL